MYVERLPERVVEIQAAVDTLLGGDSSGEAELRSIGHQLKGTGTSFGFPELTELGGALELAPSDQLPSAAKDLLDELERVIESTKADTPSMEIDASQEIDETKVHEALHLQRFFDLSLELLCTASFDGYFKQLNPAWTEVLGWSREELRARPFIEFVHPDDLEATDLETSKLTTGAHVTIGFENRWRSKDGSWRWLRWTATIDHERQVFMALARDVTEERATEAALRAAKEEAESASRAKSTFLATMSHELRTPLNSVIGFSRILMRAVPPDSKEANYLGRIRDNGLHLLHVINDILDLSKIEAGHMELVLEPVDLEALVADVVGSLRGASGGLEFRAVTEQPVTARTDGARLRQVLLNLIGNALKFTSEGRVQVVVRHDDAGARIDVEDTGIGIPEHRLASIFEAFTQADPSTSRQFGGTGLGLSLSQAFCEHLGVELCATSEVGAGSVFSVVFPANLLVDAG